jgi:hypothetical protein
MVLRGLFEPMVDEVIRIWRKLYTEELHNFYSSPSIFRMIKPTRMRWAEHVAHIGAKWYAYSYKILLR